MIESIFKETGWNFPNLRKDVHMQIHKFKDQEWPKEDYARTHNNQTVEYLKRKTKKNFESSKIRDSLHTRNEPYWLQENQHISQKKPGRTGGNKMIYLKCSQETKMLTMKIIPGKGKEVLSKYSQTKKDWRSSSPRDLTYKKFHRKFYRLKQRTLK